MRKVQPTAAEVKEYRLVKGCSLKDAHRKLLIGNIKQELETQHMTSMRLSELLLIMLNEELIS